MSGSPIGSDRSRAESPGGHPPLTSHRGWSIRYSPAFQTDRYFDERGVARVYEMSFEGGVWKLERMKEDFSPFEFSQRFTGTFSNDRKRIEGTWEIAHDHKTWKKDFDLIYTRVDLGAP